MGKNVLTVNTMTAAAFVMAGTLLSSPSWVAQQAPYTQIGSNVQVVETALPLLGCEIIVGADIAAWVKFRKLRQEWIEQRGAMSSITAVSMLRPYQQIIGMGVDALALILAELKGEGDDPDQWFWALSIIAEANNLEPPQIGAHIQGDYQAMAQLWLEWGESHGYAR